MQSAKFLQRTTVCQLFRPDSGHRTPIAGDKGINNRYIKYIGWYVLCKNNEPHFDFLVDPPPSFHECLLLYVLPNIQPESGEGRGRTFGCWGLYFGANTIAPTHFRNHPFIMSILVLPLCTFILYFPIELDHMPYSYLPIFS